VKLVVIKIAKKSIAIVIRKTNRKYRTCDDGLLEGCDEGCLEGCVDGCIEGCIDGCPTEMYYSSAHNIKRT
jgi:hypothetical protein